MQDVVLDACCLINLYAAGKILTGDLPAPKPPRRRILRRGSSPITKKLALDFTLYIPAKVQEEAKYILQPDEDDPTKLVKAEISLGPLIEAGVLHTCDLEGEEPELFVQMATKLDDGEAACFAIAKCRGWLLATDERPTEKLAKKHDVAIVTTPELVKHWADKAGATDEDVANILWNVQTYAHYFPRKALPMHLWWMDLVRKANGP